MNMANLSNNRPGGGQQQSSGSADNDNDNDNVFDLEGNELFATLQTQEPGDLEVVDGPPIKKAKKDDLSSTSTCMRGITAQLATSSSSRLPDPVVGVVSNNLGGGNEKTTKSLPDYVANNDDDDNTFDFDGDNLVASVYLYDTNLESSPLSEPDPEPTQWFSLSSGVSISSQTLSEPLIPHHFNNNDKDETKTGGIQAKNTNPQTHQQQPTPSTSTNAKPNDSHEQEQVPGIDPDESSTSSPMFDDGQDEFLWEIADAVEDSEELLEGIENEGWVEDDGIEEENRFRTRLGRPHPMLMPEIISIVFGYINCGETLKSCRLVCNVWNEEATPRATKYLNFRNVSHVVAPFPYGLGYSNLSHSFTCPYPIPPITRIRIADPCTMFSTSEVSDFFKTLGSQIKYFGFEANFYCVDHITFLRRVLTTWCTRSLEEVELIGVANTDFVKDNCNIYFDSSVKLGLKRFKIVGGEWNRAAHYHYSSVQRSIDRHYRFIMDGGDEIEYGGIVYNILRSCPQLESLELDLGYRDLGFCLVRYAMMNLQGVVGTSGKNLKEVVLTGRGTITRPDINTLQHCNFSSLTRLVIGTLGNYINREDFENLLISLSSTLEELEIQGVADYGLEGRLRVFRFRVSMLEKLKKLVLGDGCRLRVEDLLSLSSSLKELTIKCRPINNRHWQVVRRFLNRLVLGVGAEVRLERLAFESAEGVWLEHRGIVRSLRQNATIRSVSVDCFLDDGGMATCMQAYSTMTGLEELSVKVLHGQWSGNDWIDFPSGVRVWAGLRVLKIFNLTNVRFMLRLQRLREFLHNTSGFFSLELTGFMIYDDEAEEMARYLVDHVNFIRFTNFFIVKKGYEDLKVKQSLLWEGTGRQQFVKFNETRLCRVNVGMRVRELFHRL